MNLLNNIPQSFPSLAFYVIFVWSIFWKGLALWKAAKYGQRNWFIVILIVNAVGILEIVYLFGFAKTKMKISELKFWGTKKK